MSKEKYNLSRRSVLGGLGAAGLAAAGAGLGTTAYLNDTESFEGNKLTAGELDLRIDWQQKYYGPTEQWEFVNAHPDHDGDGEQSLTDDIRYSNDDRNIVDHLDCSNLDHEYDFGDQQSLVELNDVKPGDEGEITFSLHLCDNPGYIWLTADNFSESGGVTTEPENATMGAGDSDDGELAENTFVEFWYDDNCDNVLQRDGDGGTSEKADVVIVMDVSGSMDGELSDAQAGANALIDALGDDDQVGLVSFSTSGTSGGTDDSALDAGLTGDHSSVKSTVNSLSAGGRTNMEAGVERAHEELLGADTFAEYDESGGARSGARKIMVVLGDGQPNEGTDVTDTNNEEPRTEATNAKDDGIEIFTIAYGSGSPSGLLGDMASDPATNPADQYAYAATTSDIIQVFQDIGGSVSAGETVILGKGDGVHTDHVTLAEAMDIMENNGGMVPLDGTGDMGYGEGPTSDERDCFESNTSYCIGARWWVPTSVGNEIQGDSVGFDLGFYTEQCRHNDGSGPQSA